MKNHAKRAPSKETLVNSFHFPGVRKVDVPCIVKHWKPDSSR
jgi:hypothetical protein